MPTDKAESKDRIRVHVRMGTELHAWFEKKADELGVPTTALMVVAMNEYRKAQTASDNMPMLAEMFKLIQSGELPTQIPFSLSDQESV